jgi:ribosomal-protein-alanine N-acetyltransferase
MNADPEVRKYFPSVLDESQALGEAGRIRGAITQRGWGMWALEIPGVFPFAGFVGLSVPGFEAPWMPAVEVGWRLRRDAWGKGYASEGAKAALRFAFNQLELPEVVAMSVVSNAPSHKVMARLGMVHDVTADFDHPRVPADWPLKRHLLHRISRESWTRRQP